MNRPRLAFVAAIGVTVILAACGGDDETTSPSLLDVPETVAIGVLPDPLSDAETLPSPPPPPSTAPETSATTAPDDGSDQGPIVGPIGEHVSGDRVILIGDSILAATAPRNDGLMCDALALFGWQAEIDAEPGRDIDFADDVLDDRLLAGGGDDWDAVVLSFGSQVDGTDSEAVDAFADDLDAVLDRVSPRPTIIFTIVDDRDGRDAVNDVIRDRPSSYSNVVIVEFADAGSDGVDVVDSSGLTLTDDGMKRLSTRTAAALGKAPGISDGECLPSNYVDDGDATG